MYILVTESGTTFPYSATDLIISRPDVSWPSAPLSDETLASFNVYPVEVAAEPAYNPMVQVLVRNTPVNADGKWSQDWTVQNRPQEEAAAAIRAARNAKLAESDWTQGKDIADAVSTPWATYRQALRDLPAQPGFPWDVQWPTKPE
jgi:hypothetical protein